MSACLPIRGEYVVHEKGTRLADHRHTDAQLTMMRQGTLSVRTAEGLRLVPPGRAIWIACGLPHSVYYSESAKILNVFVAADEAARVRTPCRTFAVTPLLKALLDEVADFARPGRDNSDAGLILSLLIHQLNTADTRRDWFIAYGQDRRLRTAIDAISRQPAENTPLRQLAARAGCSERTLARLFIRETGMNYLHWRDHYRVMCAVERLSRGFSITQVALDMGYGGANNFSTMFARVTGMPPRRYMDAIRT
ncbi:AraC family transcriptional regulator [Martelella alba]|uniref:Helix-turn-helix transcriptional regulator n=1 Tax=Martelella alba TaxID=2590451 RepID=A0ABY2SKK6_9HYPH|nr:helix-turn-helix transcriptional regulator [Martelella alba]TKI06113.1 helix-turn-helix transcriptional regulator [Martelella alba]